MTTRKIKRIKKIPCSRSRYIRVADLPSWVCAFHWKECEEAEDSLGAEGGREFIRRRLQSKEVIIFSRSVARSLIKVAAERNQQGPHQFYVSSFFLRELLTPLSYQGRSDSGDSLSNLITATFNWICDRRESTFGSFGPFWLAIILVNSWSPASASFESSPSYFWYTHIAWKMWN